MASGERWMRQKCLSPNDWQVVTFLWNSRGVYVLHLELNSGTSAGVTFYFYLSLDGCGSLGCTCFESLEAGHYVWKRKRKCHYEFISCAIRCYLADYFSPNLAQAAANAQTINSKVGSEVASCLDFSMRMSAATSAEKKQTQTCSVCLAASHRFTTSH